MPEINASVKNQYLETDKSINIQNHLKQLEKEEKSGLKGIEIRDSAKQLGKDDFLKLLISQLSQQDPTNPMKDQEFIAQMAQFSSLEQMKNISTGISRMESKQAYSVVGKIISGPDLVTGEDVVGVAGAIFFDNQGKTYARVNGKTVDIEKISLISDPNLVEKPLGDGNINSQTKRPIANPDNVNNALTSTDPSNPINTESTSKSEIQTKPEINSKSEIPTNPKINSKSEIPTNPKINSAIQSTNNQEIPGSPSVANFPTVKNSSEMEIQKIENSYNEIPGYRPLGGRNLPYAD